MNSFTRNKPAPQTMPQPLAVLVRDAASGSLLAREPVLRTDLADAVAEAWRDQCLRAGYPERPLAEVPMTLVPLFPAADSGRRCVGFAIDVELPNGRVRRHEFSLLSLKPVATRAIESLVASGIFSSQTVFRYEVTVDDFHPASSPSPTDAIPFAIHVRSQPQSFLPLPLRPLLRRSTAVDMLDDDAFPVFFTAEALAKAEASSRAGAGAVPPLESGGVLVGSLGFCEAANELFSIVTDVLDANEAEQSTFSLSYSGRSWNRIQAIVQAKQACHPERCVRLLGQCHGHNFLPNDGRVCDECPKRPECGLTSVFVSGDDRTWMGAVFAHQPWALCQIFGLNARQEPVHRLYSLRDGCWQPRGYFLLPDFAWPQDTSPEAVASLHT